MKRADSIVLRLVLGGVGIAVAALIISESATLSKMATNALGGGESDGPTFQIIERRVNTPSDLRNKEDPDTSALSPPETSAEVIAVTAADEAMVDSTATETDNTATLPATTEPASAVAKAFTQKAPTPTNRNRSALVVGNNEYQSVPR